MNRIFHARVPWYTPILLILSTIVAVWAYWNCQGVLAFVVLALMFLIIERAITTAYTVTTDNLLIIHRGRFSKDVVIPLSEIHHIECVRSARIGSICLKRYLLVHYADGRTVSLIPSKEKELLSLLSRLQKND